MSEEKQDKILRKLNLIDEKLNELMKKVDDLSSNPPSASDAGSGSLASSAGRKPSDVVMENKLGEKDVEPDGGRITCPDCGAVGGDVGKKKDKDNVITYIGGVPQYATKYYCKKCQKEWTQ